MKKIYALGLSLLFLASCSSDDGGSSIDTSQLTKKWYFESTIFQGQTFPYDDHEECGKDYIEFVEGGVVRQVDIWDCEEDVYEGEWSLDGNKLTISFMGQSATATITKLTETEFDVKTKYDFDDDGTEETVTETHTSN